LLSNENGAKKDGNNIKTQEGDPIFTSKIEKTNNSNPLTHPPLLKQHDV